ncbi:MAG: threonine--tRNA ligase [Candidatus Shapirobacteria bacterium]|nr:threonine--tRNA ligase [Candidatus Shapirobacteria bacterium]
MPSKKTDNNLNQIRHSTEHILTQAMENLYPNKFIMAMGPATDDGFYFDFETIGNFKISDTDFPIIEAEMTKIIKQNLPIVREEINLDEAKKLFKNNPYKMEWLESIKNKGEVITVYKTGNDFIDLCAGPHAKSTSEIKAFKLLSVAGAYWHGDEKNKMLTRIYGTAFENKEELEKYLQDLEDSKNNDHRKIGQDLKLFVFSDIIGKGLPTFGPKGATIKRELERFTVDEELKRGYHHVVTPDLAKVDLYKKSGHYPYYKDTMYPIMKIDEEELILKPMTCPHHFMFYKSEPHSYRDLPYRIGEIAHQYRYEKSGELSGLTRVRMFCLADAHIISAKEQAKQVIKEVLELVDFINGTLGMIKGTDYRYRLSLGDRTDTKKYYKDDASWNYAENVLREVLTETKSPFYEASNEAAFYGPKIDIQVKKAGGKEETAFTVQYDFVMPNRFDLVFTNKEGKEERPVVIHRSSIGCLERTIAFLIEKFKGAFPVWISPIQVKIIPITDGQLEYAQKIEQTLKDNNIRVELDDKSETMQNKIRNATAEKVPYMIIIGGREVENNTISIRQRDGQDLGVMSFDNFLEKIKDQVSKKDLNLIK